MQVFRIFVFSGDLGAGKTTLVSAILKAIGVTDQVTSPTFTYVQLYKDQNGLRYYHFDLYRFLQQDPVRSFEQAGFMEYLHDAQGFSFIEWGDGLDQILTMPWCYIEIETVSPEERTLRLYGKQSQDQKQQKIKII